MICKRSVIQRKEQPSALKIALIAAGIILATAAALVILYNFFKKHFKITLDCDCGENCEDCGDDEIFADCEFYTEGDGAYVPEIEEEVEEIEIEENE